ncbi:MAG: hypothetical protein K2G85_08125 [Muribaculaceae bacterium]|nr:hypothetical protein [Muribaculaceae bacterium]
MKKIFTLISGLLLMSAIPVKAETIKVSVKDYDGYKLCQAFESELSKDDAGNYVIEDFFGSGCPMKFTFDKVVGDWGDLSITELCEEDGGDVYLLTPEGGYMTCQAWDFDGIKDWTPITYPCVALDGYSYVYTYDLTDPEYADKKEYYASVCMYGTAPSVEFDDWMYLTFSFNEPVGSKVESVAGAEIAPIEYYNISGQKVDNPSNGIFLRKQGNKVSKIAIR